MPRTTIYKVGLVRLTEADIWRDTELRRLAENELTPASQGQVVYPQVATYAARRMT